MKGDGILMPDGRPLYAWENEVKMARAEKTLYEGHLKSLQEWLMVRGIIEKKSWKEPGMDKYKILLTIDGLAFAMNTEKAIIEGSTLEILTGEESI